MTVMDVLLARLSESLTTARSLEDLTRPMLEMLLAVTGMESTYLTVVDEGEGLQQVMYACNTRQLQIPEGLRVPWTDTLCKRALEEKRPYTNEVQRVWGDSGAARDLGIQTYASTPVRAQGGALYGTLCAASSARLPLPENAEHVLQLFSQLISQQMQRELLVQKLEKANAELQAFAITDSLTGLPNRRALMATLERMLAQATRDKTSLLVCFLDLDGFKHINDTYGHEVGDAFLSAMARRITQALRGGDFLARFGGDEFVLVGHGPSLGEPTGPAVQAFQKRVSDATVGSVPMGAYTIDYAGASAGVVAIDPLVTPLDEALKQADAAMYVVKRTRQTTSPSGGSPTWHQAPSTG